MAIAFRRPFTLETQELRDATDMSGKVTEEIACQACKTIYVFLYPNTATSEQIRLYRSAVQQAMGGLRVVTPLSSTCTCRSGEHEVRWDLNFMPGQRTATTQTGRERSISLSTPPVKARRRSSCTSPRRPDRFEAGKQRSFLTGASTTRDSRSKDSYSIA